MFSRKFVLPAAVLLLGGSALACGPFFPATLLQNREETLKAAPNNGFVFEAMHLVSVPDDGLKPVEPSNGLNWNDGMDDDAAARKSRTEMEAIGLSGDQVVLVAKMRTSETGDTAFAMGAGLPDAVRLYTAAAVDFAHQRWPEAQVRLKAVLDLAGDDGLPRRTWAAYTLGRLQAQQDDAAEATAAARTFAEVRSAALDGAPDPLGLAVASYGEEAKIHLDAAAELVSDHKDAQSLPAEVAAAYRTEISAAVSLYAIQAAHKSHIGIQSLRVVAETLLATPALTAAAIDDPLTRRLLVVYVAAGQDDRIGALVAALEAKNVVAVEGADRLAAASYQTGRYDFAARLADRVRSPLASWVKAKLALQKGDLAAADDYYADAIKGFPTDASLPPWNAQRAVGERATLILTRGEYVEAMEQLYPVGATYWSDVAYLAERVLTLDELKGFVDQRLPTLRAASEAQPPMEEGEWDVDPAMRLRTVLARRLVRAGRYQEAVGYFGPPDPKDKGADGKPIDAKVDVVTYAAALKQAVDAWRGIDRAEGWYKAASLARSVGMEMMGTEGYPDFTYSRGVLEGGLGGAALDQGPITDGERRRFDASVAEPNHRFHYRFIAVDEAVKAADLLPPRSQAFAAVLCRATGWMLGNYGDPDRVAALYGRYLKQGAHVPWAANFGRDCPEPDFAAAKHLQWVEPVWAIRHFVSRYRWPISAALLVMLGAGVTLLRHRRHRVP